MSEAARKLLAEALALPAEDRELLASQLWHSLDGDDLDGDGPLSAADRDQAWTAEIARRDRELQDGSVKPMTVDEAMHFITSPDPALDRA